jgi:hypothetical protein
MPYVIKAVSTSGDVSWITRPGAEGSRTIAHRRRADVLLTVEGARRVIARMPRALTDAGIMFSVVETYKDLW